LETERLPLGWIYFVKNIVGYEEGTEITQLSIGYVSGDTFMIMKKSSAQNPFETVGYHGEIVLKETDRIRVRFHNNIWGQTIHVCEWCETENVKCCSKYAVAYPPIP